MIVETPPLPTYRRGTDRFTALFQAPAGRVVAAMDQAEDDVVNQPPRLAIELDGVGYTRARIPVRVHDPFGSGMVTTASCTVSIRCGVDGTRRGLHMSRLGDALARSILIPYPTLSEYARTLAEAVSRAEHGSSASVKVRASIPYLEDVPLETGAREKLSLEELILLANVRLAAGDAEGGTSGSGVRFTHIVACPCVQKTYRHARALSRDPLPPAEDDRPLMTHTQRCVTTVLARGLERPIDVVDFLSMLDGVVTRTANTLPRGGELAMVYRAHAAPQFIEDALRETLWALYRTIDDPAGFTCLKGRSRSEESIHEFDLCASATLTPADALHCARTA
jgi:GTP cyclohydrolase FolE2